MVINSSKKNAERFNLPDATNDMTDYKLEGTNSWSKLNYLREPFCGRHPRQANN